MDMSEWVDQKLLYYIFIFNDLTWLDSFHLLQFDDVTLAEAEHTFFICHITLQGNHMAGVLQCKEEDVQVDQI